MGRGIEQGAHGFQRGKRVTLAEAASLGARSNARSPCVRTSGPVRRTALPPARRFVVASAGRAG